jgi:hypothetical protein
MTDVPFTGKKYEIDGMTFELAWHVKPGEYRDWEVTVKRLTATSDEIFGSGRGATFEDALKEAIRFCREHDEVRP